MTEPINDPAPDDDSTPLDIAAARKLRSEARNLRERLREAEARATAAEEQVGAAAAQLGAYQLQEVQRIAGAHLVDPEDLLRHQPDMAQYFDDEFGAMVSADKVSSQAMELARSKPHLAKPQNTPPPTDRPIEGLRSGAMPQQTPTTGTTWAEALRGQ